MSSIFNSKSIDGVSDVPGLQAALDAKAPTASPTFTGTVTASGAAYVMSGSPASAGASVRNQHGNGGTTDTCWNVPTGGAFRKSINGSAIWYLDSATMSLNGQIRCDNANPLLFTNADTKQVAINGGSAWSRNNGGGITCFGNTHASTPGDVVVEAGDVAGGDVIVRVANTDILKFNRDKSATLDSTFAASLGAALGVGFVGCSLSYSTTQQIGTSFTELSIDTENADPNGMHTSTNTYATVQTGQGGTWEIEAIVVASLIPGTDTHGSDNRHIPEIEIYKNGSTSLRTSRGGILSPGTFVGTNPAECLTVGIITSLAAGDTIRIRARESNSTGANYKFQLVELKMKRLGA